MALPLHGLRVVDFTQNFAGPFCTMILSGLGAEVVKVEKPDGGDETRQWGPPFIEGVSYYYRSLNHGKKSITLDLKKKEDQEKIQRMVVDADILVESSRPGTMQKFGLDYPKLRRLNSALVYCSISSFGQTGPYRDRVAYDLVAYAMSGIMATTGEEGTAPVRMSVPVADIAAGHYASTAILAALSRRLVTGRGDYIDIALYDSIVSWLTYLAEYYFATGKEPARMGSAHPSIVPYQAFKCKDRYLVLAVGNDKQWTSFCKATGQEKLLASNRFITNKDRVKNRKHLIPVLQDLFRVKNAKDWEKLLVGARVPAAVVRGLPEVARDLQLRNRRMMLRGSQLGLGTPMKFYRLGSKR